MILERIKELYPIGKTFVGNYSYYDQSFTITAANQVDDIEEWDNCPFDHDNSALPFLEYVGNGKFEAYAFLYEKVGGYLSQDGQDFDLAAYSPDFNWEIYDPVEPDDFNMIMEPDMEEYKEYGWDKYGFCSTQHRIEQAAKRYNLEAYLAGNLITSPAALKEFCKKLEEKGEIG